MDALQVIARIHTELPEKFGVPRQSGLVPQLRGRIVFEPAYRNPDAVRGLEDFSHLWLIWQFSEAVRQDFEITRTVHLPALLGVSPDMPIWDIDLRQESHGFLNHAAVSWHGPQNAANRGLAATEVEQDETARLQRALGHVVQALPMGRYDEEHIKNSFDEPVQSWSTERELARRAGLGYKRFAATDMEWPAPAVIDDFVDFYRSLPKNHGWLFFHCQAGQGRTTTFMVLYELLEHPSVTADEAIAHQRSLGGADLSSGPRYHGLQLFAHYVKENCASNFQQTWSQWLAARQNSY